MGNAEGIHRCDQVIAELKKELDVHIQGQKVDAERIERLQMDHNNACRTIKELLKKRDLADAKNEDACKTIADLLAQVESLQIANSNLVNGNEILRERVKNLREANEKLIANEDNLRSKLKQEYMVRKETESSLFESCATVQKLQKKIRKLKKKTRLLVKVAAC